MTDNRKPLIIGLGHYSRVGKDTFADALVAQLREDAPERRVAKMSFASKLKDVTHQLYGWAGLRDEDYYNDPEHEHERDEILPVLGMTPVTLWVRFGSDAVRDHVWRDTWADYLLSTDHKLDVMVIPDVRFPNEVEAIRKRGGHLIKVVRNGCGPKLTSADMVLYGWDGWDNVIGDSITPSHGIAGLRRWAAIYADRILWDVPLNEHDDLVRPPEEIQAALAVEVPPGPCGYIPLNSNSTPSLQ